MDAEKLARARKGIRSLYLEVPEDVADGVSAVVEALVTRVRELEAMLRDGVDPDHEPWQKPVCFRYADSGGCDVAGCVGDCWVARARRLLGDVPPGSQP